MNSITDKIKEIDKCLCCLNDDLRTILDLGKQPLANSYHSGETLERFPLKLNLCYRCTHLQLSHAVNPDLMFKNYLYVSGTSNTLQKYFDWFANYTLEYNPNAKTILDIACNDGTQLNYYKQRGLETYGIDPAENLAPISKNAGHNIVVDYFTEESLSNFGDTKFDIITAQNVFAHNTYPDEFLKLCGKILSDSGNIFIQTSQADMVKNNEFDTIYHEHISFFNIASMLNLVSRCGLYLNDVRKPDIHGWSFVFVISNRNEKKSSVDEFLKDYSNNKLNNLITYLNYAFAAYITIINLKNKIEEYRGAGYEIVGYGAAAKGNTLLNFGEIKLDYILDDNPLKHNLFTPGMNILIKEPNYISELDSKKILFVPLAWNFYKEIKSKIKSYRDNSEDVFLKYFPQILIEN